MPNIRMNGIRDIGLTLCLAANTVLAINCSATAQTKDPIKFLFMDPMSGPFALIGEIGVAHSKFAIDRINARGGVLGGRKLEMVPYDDKLSPQEAVAGVQAAVDQGIRIVVHNTGAALASAALEAVNKHNQRNPEKSILFISYSQDSTLTDKTCNYYMFRFSPNSDMNIAAMTVSMADDKNVKKIYVLNQDYSYGRSVQEAFRSMISQKLPGTEIVGDELHPLAKIKDFSPYVAKIKAAGADTVFTSSWGSDLQLFARAVRDAGLPVKLYTSAAGGFGTPTAIGDAGIDRIVDTAPISMNVAVTEKRAELEKLGDEFKTATKQDLYYIVIFEAMEMLARAMDKAGSAEPKLIAAALGGMEYDSPVGKVSMRAEDHQLLMPMYSSVFQKGLKYDVEGTGIGWNPVRRAELADVTQPVKCRVSPPQ